MSMFLKHNLCTILKNSHTSLFQNQAKVLADQQRFKSKGGKKNLQIAESGSESDKEDPKWEDGLIDKHTKLVNSKITSMRADVVIKAGLGMARNKVETLFYESKIRVNGKKLTKKSETVHEGDEIDVVKGASVDNPNFLNVARVEVLSAKPGKDNFEVKLRRSKSLTIDNYEEKWTPESQTQ